MSFTPRSSEIPTMAKQARSAKRTGRFSTTLRAGVWRSPLSSRGSSAMAAKKKTMVTTGVLMSVYIDGLADFDSEMATASRPQRAMSSTVATVRQIRAKRVCMIPRSRKILEITGIEVMATAIPMMIVSELMLPWAPM